MESLSQHNVADIRRSPPACEDSSVYPRQVRPLQHSLNSEPLSNYFGCPPLRTIKKLQHLYSIFTTSYYQIINLVKVLPSQLTNVTRKRIKRLYNFDYPTTDNPIIKNISTLLKLPLKFLHKLKLHLRMFYAPTRGIG